MTKKIVIAAGLFPPDIGGPATYAAMVAAALPSAGIDVEVVPYGLVRNHSKLTRHLRYLWLLYQKSRDVDAIYALDPMSVGLPALLVARLRRKPLLVRLGGDYAWEQGVQRFGITDTLDEYTKQPHRYGWRVRLFAWLQRMVVKRARVTIVPSEYLKGIVSTWRGVDLNNISVVYSALFPLPAPADRATVRSQLNYIGFTLVTACRLVPWKGVSGLLTMVQQLRETIPDIQLIVIGGGTEEAALKEQVREQHLTEQVRFTGPLGKEALGSAIAAADVFVYNTAYEGLSHQLLEVIDLGVPIVTTNVGGNPELITDNTSGLMVDFNDVTAFVERVKILHAAPDLRTRYAAEAKSLLPQFQQSVAVERLVAVLSKTLYA